MPKSARIIDLINALISNQAFPSDTLTERLIFSRSDNKPLTASDLL